MGRRRRSRSSPSRSAIERAIAQWKFVTRARALGDTVTRCLSRGALDEGRSACERSPSPIADVFLVGYERLGRAKPEHVVTAVHRERLRVNQDLRARLWMLGTVGATAPFVGLFGTVVGIMSAMGGFNGDETVKFSMVSGPISEALDRHRGRHPRRRRGRHPVQLLQPAREPRSRRR